MPLSPLKCRGQDSGILFYERFVLVGLLDGAD